MSGAGASFAGNAVATLVIGYWVGEFDKNQADRVLAGEHRSTRRRARRRPRPAEEQDETPTAVPARLEAAIR
jgi:hypothetical protein